jgi:DNA polymerase-3 subunit delta'
VRHAEPTGHAEVLAGLFRAARDGRLAHALCFVGPEGVGKFLAAEQLAMGLLCAQGPRNPCGVCGPCKRAKIDSHPDVFVLDPTEEGSESIAIAHVTPRAGGPEQTIEQFLALRPMEGGWRIVLIREADRMVEEAQNALLKTLEEPGESTLLVLETARPDRLLPTIHSRCVRVPFRSLSDVEVAAILRREGLDTAQSTTLSRWSQGAPGAALALASRGAIEMRALLEQAFEGGFDPFATAREVSEIDGDFPGKTAPARSRARARSFLDLAASVLRDALRASAGIAPDSLPHGDLVTRLARAPEGALSSALERILDARQDVDANLAPDAALERAFLALEPLSTSPAARASRR